MMEALVLWIQTVFFIAGTMATVPYNLLMLVQNSSETFGHLWSHTEGLNDGNVQYGDISELLTEGNFRAKIYSNWGLPVQFNLMFVSKRGYRIGEMIFDVTDFDVDNLTAWFSSDRLVYWWPQPVSSKYITMTVSDGDRELYVTDNVSGDAWFSIVHGSTYISPAIAVALNNTSLISTEDRVTGISYEGCYPDSEVSPVYMYEDSSSMTVESCILACNGSGEDYVGLQEGLRCFCASFISQMTDVPHMCTLGCPGNVTQNCGGTNVGYYAIYSGTTELSDVDHLKTPNTSVLLVNYTDTSYLHDTTNVSMVDELQWNENYAYISNISVTAMTDDENYTQYWFTFASSEYGHQIYANAIGEPPLLFPTNGSNIAIDTLPMAELNVYFLSPVVNSTILLYGPNESYVLVPFLALEGYFDILRDQHRFLMNENDGEDFESNNQITSPYILFEEDSTSITSPSAYTKPITLPTTPFKTNFASTISASPQSASSLTSSTASLDSTTASSSVSTSTVVPPVLVNMPSTPDSTSSFNMIVSTNSTSASLTSSVLLPHEGASAITDITTSSPSSGSSGLASSVPFTSSTPILTKISLASGTTSNSPVSTSTAIHNTGSSLASGGTSQTTSSPKIVSPDAASAMFSSASLTMSTRISTSVGSASHGSVSASTTTRTTGSSQVIKSTSPTSNVAASSPTMVSSTSSSVPSVVSITTPTRVSTALVTSSSSPVSILMTTRKIGSSLDSGNTPQTTDIAPVIVSSGTVSTASSIFSPTTLSQTTRTTQAPGTTSASQPESFTGTGSSPESSSTTSKPSVTINSELLRYCLPNCSVPLLIGGKTYCPCKRAPENQIFDIEEVIAELTIDKKQVSAYVRKYICAEDTRPSAQTLGSLAVIILVAVIAFVISLDRAALVREIRRLVHNYKHMKRRFSKSVKVNSLRSIQTQNDLNIEEASITCDQIPTVSQ